MSGVRVRAAARGAAMTLATLLSAATSAAQDPSVPTAPSDTAAPTTAPTSPASPATPSPSPVPPASEPDDQHFRVDPIFDCTFIAVTAGFAGVNELILTTGEIRPQRPADPSVLLSIDRGAVTQTIDPNAGTISNVGIYLAMGYAVLDPVLSGVRDGVDAAIVDLVLYAESLSLTLVLTDISKVAVRRPRPRAYSEQAKLDAQFGGADKSPSISDTDASLSFFSGHAAMTAAAGATATYLAFRRSPRSWRPWVTLAAATVLTAGVSIERVRAGAHFPTDVIAGAFAGAAVGVLVPHLHRRDAEGRVVWVGAAPVPGGGSVSLTGTF